ncbi:Flagellar basal-body rod protein FlgG [Planctomycetes bacterium Pan216]|uniref:Flagellar basal-body rod protein FlgG n=1 Tax=Kolteria novifilia TaxID=2527975 RepID=A0A518AXS8_9BACT|nr:Flagellar basal-body rod protein FlgG [Planctomycetes bacterium Pan216]
MIYGYYISMAGAQTQSYRTDVIANNVANIDTAGFRRQFAIVQARQDHQTTFGDPPPLDPGNPRNMGGGVFLHRTASDTSTEGAYEVSNRATDLALEGDGFFVIRKGDERFLTRNGTFELDSQGFLVTQDGSGQVLATNGEPIRLDPQRDFYVDWRGQVAQDGNPIATIARQTPEDPDDLKPLGKTLFSFEGDLVPTNARVEQRLLEGSNVETVHEMTGLIEAARAYQLNINMIQLQNDQLATLIQQVPNQQ